MTTPSRQQLRDWSDALTLGPLDPADPKEPGTSRWPTCPPTCSHRAGCAAPRLPGSAGSGAHVRPRPGQAADTVAKTVAELREVVARRLPVDQIFASKQLDAIIQASGRHLRDLSCCSVR